MPEYGDDLYGGMGAQEASPEPEAKSETKQEEGGKSYLINKDVCPGMKPGEEMVVKIERVLENEYEVSYAPEKDHDEEGMPEEAAPPMAPPAGGGGSDMASMMY